MRLRPPRRIQPVPGVELWGTSMHSGEGQRSPDQRLQYRDSIFSRACLLNVFTLSRRGFSPRNMPGHNGITSETPPLMGLQNFMYRSFHFPGDVSETNGIGVDKHSVTRRTM